jgi:septal ring factor EnvC (AmiA/AmiB activator)
MRSRTGNGWLVACAALSALAALGATAGDEPADGLPLAEQIAASTTQLADLRARIADHRARLDEISSETRDAQQKLQDLTAEMAMVKNLLAGLDGREQMLRERSDSLRARLRLHEEEYGRRQDLLAVQLRQLYMHGRRRNLELILMSRFKFAALVAQQDIRLLEKARLQGLAVLADQRDLNAALAGIWEAREEAAQQRLRLEEMELDRRSALAELQRQRDVEKSSLSQLEANARRLGDLLADLEKVRTERQERIKAEDTPFARDAGALDWPVAGEVIRGFGRTVHEEFGTVTMHNGITIAAPVGTPVYAVAAGKVEFADELPGFGRCVILDHGAGYYSLYAQLSRVYVASGGQVERNEILAEVGHLPGEETPQLYFEIRQGKTPLDPLDWLEPQRR